MKKKAIALAGCIAFAAPSVSLAKALPANFVGMNLGEIQANSYLNQPFRGVIPFLFTSIESASQFKVRVAPESVFAQIGAEKMPILNDLSFNVTVQAGKPVILISSNRPIQLPFLNFILEVEGPKGFVYQDYTVLLDPPNYQDNSIVTETFIGKAETSTEPFNLSQVESKPLKYRVKSGDTLSKIAFNYKQSGVSSKTLAQSIFKKNPKAFIRGDINKIRKGALLSMPTSNELKGVEIVSREKKAESTPVKASKETYKVSRGDSLSKITKKFADKEVSFTKMMNAIYTTNPQAFSKNRKSLLKAGAVLKIPTVQEVLGVKPLDNSVAITDKAVVEIAEPSVKPATISIDTANNGSLKTPDKNSEIKIDQYLVKDGDTLTSIAKNLDYKETSFTKLMKQIYVGNPDAFEKNNITKLIPGSIINLPKSNKVELAVKKKPAAKTIEIQAIANVVEKTNAEPSQKVTEPAVNNSLEKRIRELRAELDQAKTGISELKETLDTKDRLISEKDGELINLKSTLIKLKINTPTDISQVEAEDNGPYGVIPETKPEIAELATLALSDPESKLIEKGFNDKLGNFVNARLESMATKDLVYMSLALALGLILIRYRREIYSYTRISSEHPNYYPAKEASEYNLSEKNICYQDTLVDPGRYENINDFDRFSKNKLTQEVGFFSDDELEQTEEIEHCEHLVTELFDDLSSDNNKEDVSHDWQSIEKVCNEYIGKIKEEESSKHKADTDVVKGGIADFDEMMNDLLNSLNEVEQTIKSKPEVILKEAQLPVKKALSEEDLLVDDDTGIDVSKKEASV